MLNIPAYIPALLHNYDCVVIPDLGGFVANYSSAQLDKSKGVVYPPSKGIIFNKNLVKNDGLLVSEIAAAQNLSYMEALHEVNVFVQEAKMVLAEGGRLELEGLGYLYFDHERNIRFLQHQTVNFLNDAFGLMPVTAVPVQKKALEIKPLVKEEKPVVDTDSSRDVKEKAAEQKEATIVAIQQAVGKVKKNRKKYYWAAAVLLPLAFYSYWLPFQTPLMTTGKFSWSYLNPFGTYATPVYQERTDKLPEFAAITETPSDLNNKTIVLENTGEKIVSETTYVPQPIDTEGKHYHIIAGCFLSYDNAVTQLSELNAAGEKAFLFGQAGGFHRVALGSYATEQEAILQLKAAREGGQPNAWLLEE